MVVIGQQLVEMTGETDVDRGLVHFSSGDNFDKAEEILRLIASEEKDPPYVIESSATGPATGGL
jgi:hypothetical protein